MEQNIKNGRELAALWINKLYEEKAVEIAAIEPIPPADCAEIIAMKYIAATLMELLNYPAEEGEDE